jgi:acetolactate synthase-1/2/3 large subunit
LRATKPQEVDGVITRMLETPGPVLVDCVVDPEENCFPMIPAGQAHNEMLLGPEETPEEVSEEGKILV